MTFYIDPMLKQYGDSDMKDWVIFFLILFVVGFGAYNQLGNLQNEHNQLVSRVIVLESNGSTGQEARVEALEGQMASWLAKNKAPKTKKKGRGH